MRKSLLLFLVVLGLTGCSELQVMGRAAVSELQVEAINVEWAAYQKQQKLAKLQREATVAKSDLKQQQGWEKNEPRRESPPKAVWNNR